MIEEDDTSLKNEFHILRFYFAKAMGQYQNALKAYQNEIPADVIGEGNRLTAMIDKLASINEKRMKSMVPLQEQIVRVQFDDPSVVYHLKEKLREMESFTIRRVLAVLMETVDPTGELGFKQRIPTSFAPYLPPPKEAHAEVIINGEDEDEGAAASEE